MRLQNFTVVMYQQVLSLLGMIQSIDTAVPLARARMGRTQWEFLASCKSEEDYNTFMYLSKEVFEGIYNTLSIIHLYIVLCRAVSESSHG